MKPITLCFFLDNHIISYDKTSVLRKSDMIYMILEINYCIHDSVLAL